MSILDDENKLIAGVITHSTMVAEIHDICKSIIENELRNHTDYDLAMSDIGFYVNQRELISRIFNSGATCGTKNVGSTCYSIYNKALIKLRLIVLDSLYSTNASYSHFTFDEMADKIWKLGHTEKQARDYFYKIACRNSDDSDDQKLFSAKYGVRKNLEEGGKQMSLMSKYAYYTLVADKVNFPLGFPIYDRLAKASYKKIRKHNVFELPSIDNTEMTIEAYVKAMKKLRQSIFGNTYQQQLFEGYQQFDTLDAYLWRMGKFSEGNLTLLMDKEDYKKFIQNIGLNGKSKEDILSVISSIKPNDTNYFNKAVMENMKQVGANSFKGLAKEQYLTTLYNHWKKYF